ncbi:MAG: NRPS [Sclerophora amabilis]|nr:MAG: NRPS [Sclerophora amabilis]
MGEYIEAQSPLSAVEYWRGYLADVEKCYFPQLTDGVSGLKQRRQHAVHLGQKAADGSLEEFCVYNNVTLPTVFKTAWALVLGRYIGTDNVSFSTVTSHRDGQRVVLCRSQLDEAASILNVMEKIEADFVGSLPYQDCALAEIPQFIDSAGRTLFNSNINFQDGAGSASTQSAGGDAIEHDITVDVNTSGKEVEIFLDYSMSSMSETQAANVAATFSQTLSEVLQNPRRTVSEIDLVSTRDLGQIRSWNASWPDMVDECVDKLFREQVDVRPGAQAVYSSDGSFTYHELDLLSTRLAHHLVTLGVGPEVIVPLCFEKSAWTVVAMLGVVKAGGALVFLDPSHPVARLEEIMGQVDARFLLTSPRYAELCLSFNVSMFVVDSASIEGLPCYDSAPAISVKPKNVLYVIFTSGSTGKPKGCVVEHASFLSGAVRQAKASSMGPTSRVLQLASYTFDVSILETITALIVGACICIPGDEARSKGIASIMNDFQITWAFLTPSLVKLIRPEDVPLLQFLVLGGEALSKSDVETWAGHVQLANGYGPTECSIAATGNANLTPNTDPANIGRALGGICWVVDAHDHNRLVPIGATGELLIQGPILARGYLNEPAKTAAVFVEGPAWLQDDIRGRSRRLYKTGDLVRYNSDGTLNFIGRKDTQVKLRGLRIELGEIEHHVSVHSYVKHAMVVLPKSGRCKQRLVAVLSLQDFPSMNGATELQLVGDKEKEAMALHITAVREYLSEHVPAYMVPTTWAVMESIPLSTSGKIDRVKVSRWVVEMDDETYSRLADLDRQDGVEVPATAMEEQLQKLCSRVLNLPVEEIRLNQSFLGLGGDSISAMQLMGRSGAEGMVVSIKDILQSKTISQLALCISTGQSALSKEEYDVPFDLLPMQQICMAEIALRERTVGRPQQFNESVFLRLTQQAPVRDVEQAIEAVVDRHSMLRSRFIRRGDGAWAQQIVPEATGSYRFRVHEVSAHDEVKSLIADAQAGLDIERGPVFIAELFNMADAQMLLLVAHQLVIDTVSWYTLQQDLEDLLKSGTLPEKGLPFQALCRLQAQHVSHGRPSEQFTLSNPVPTNMSYWNMTNSVETQGDFVEEGFQLDVETTTLLLHGCHKALQTKPEEILVAALLKSFSQTFTDRTNPTIFIESQGRESWAKDDLDWSRTVGNFSTISPLQVTMDPGFDFVDVTRRTKDTHRQATRSGWSDLISEFGDVSGHQLPLEVLFKYLGEISERGDALLRREPLTLYGVSKGLQHAALFEISAAISYGAANINFVFSRHLEHQDDIQTWIRAYERSLKEGLSQLAHMNVEHTLSDFPLLPLTYSGLETFKTKALPQIGMTSLHELEDAYPCSPMQQGILLTQNRASGTYEFQFVCEAVPPPAGTIDLPRLQNAWQKVVDRHATLRTVFVESVSQEGLYDQIVLKQLDTSVSCIHCDGEEYISAAVTKQPPVKYTATRPAHRLTLCKTPAGSVFCVIDISHALIDGTSILLLFRDLALAYEGNLSMEPKPLYRDYISYLQSQPSDDALRHWNSYLAGLLPSHFPVLRDEVEEPKQLHQININLKDVAKLQELCQIQTLTPANVFQAAWSLVLRAYIGSDDVCFGYLSSGRDAPIRGVDDAIGTFVNMLVCRLELAQPSSALQIMRQVQDDFLRGLPYQHCSLAEIQHNLHLSGQPLFNTVMSLQNTPTGEFDGMNENSPISFRAVSEYDPTEYDISVNIATTIEGVDICLRYWTSSLSDKNAANLAGTFEKAISCLVDSPDARVSELDLISDQDRNQIMAWNSVYPGSIESCVHELVEQKVQAQPAAQAVCSWDKNFTYLELDKLSTTLAHHLSSLGVGPEALVPMCFDKSAWTVVAMLAVLKAGGACVALDPMHPQGRREGIINDVRAKVAVVAPQHAGLLEGLVEHVVEVQQSLLDTLPARGSANFTKPSVQPVNPAFVVFTSGSTGKPKGIVLEHRSLCTSARAHGPAMRYGPDSRILQFAAYTFDVSIGEIFTTLMHGGCICVPSEDDKMNDLAGVINRMNVNCAYLTPTVASLLQPSDVPNLKTLALGGEAVRQDNVSLWSDKIYLINIYGPAECTIWSTGLGPLDHKTSPANIGRGLGALMWITDASNHDRLCPIGRVGELLIEGPIVAREYVNEKEKTAAAFIESPEWTKGDGVSRRRRMYKTGDLVRYNSDGTINYIGRKDNQIKLHGQRIELGEIEHHLSTHDLVRNVVVVLPKSGYCKERLVALMSLEDMASKSSDEAGVKLIGGVQNEVAGLRISAIREYLEGQVPGYMVPSTWVVVEAIPLTTSGKTNRLIMTKWAEDMNEETYHEVVDKQGWSEMPATVIERQLQAVWGLVLNMPVDRIRMNRSFLSLGGDSITAMQVRTQCRAQGITLTVQDILRSKTISQLALCAKSVSGQSSFSRDEDLDVPFDLSPIQQLYFNVAPQGPKAKGSHHFNQSFLLRLGRSIAAADLARSLEAVVRQHSMLRARFQQHGGRWMQLLTQEVAESYRFEVHEVAQREEMMSLVASRQSELDIESGPIFTADLFKFPGDEQVLFLVAHHLVIDLVSWRIILQDLEEILESGTLAAEKPLSFQTWSRLQAEYSQQHLTPQKVLPIEIAPADIGYWGMADRANVFGDVLKQTFTLDVEKTSSLFGICNDALHTEPVDIILSAMIQSFNRTFKRESPLAIFSEGHGREPWDANVDPSSLVGWFTTMSPLSVAAPDEADDFVEMLRRTKDTRRRVPGNGWPYFTSRFLNSEGVQAFQDHTQMEVLFNYLGRYQQLERKNALLQIERLEDGESVRNVGEDVQRFALFEISALVVGDRATFSFEYNKHMQSQDKILQWIKECEQSLDELVDRLGCLEPQRTLSDFPLLPLNYPGLKALDERILKIKLSDATEVEDAYPCSPMQRGILLSQAQTSGTYEFQMVCEVVPKGDSVKVDIDRFRSAWQKVVDRHPVLRTIFMESVCEDGLYDQIVLKHFDARIVHVKCDDVSSFLDEQSPINYDEARPLHRLTLCESAGRVFCKLEISHTLIDGTSISILIRDIGLAYEDKLPAGSGPLYSDYISHLQSLPRDEALLYWKGYLADVKPCQFPLLNDVNEEATSKQLRSVKVNIEDVSKLHQFCQARNFTLANVFQMAWGLVLRTYTGSDQVCFGYMASGRDVPVDGIDDAVGAFINMLVCRLDVMGSVPVIQAVELMQGDFLNGLSHQHCSLAEIQHSLNLPSGQALFNTMLSLQRSMAEDALETSDILFQNAGGQDPTEYELSVNISTSDEEVDVSISYWTSTLSAMQAANVASTFNKALTCILNTPDSTIGELDLFSEQDQSQIWEWNGNGKLPEAVESCIHEMIQQQALTQPDAPAVCSWDGAFSYSELDQLSTRLAHHLVGFGIKPEVLVPLCFDKSAWTVVAMMGVLKAGGAYVALDPSHPTNRLEGIIHDTNAKLALAGVPHANTLKGLVEDVVVVGPSLFNRLPVITDANWVKASPINAAFVCFTSGSTGKPKGIILEHRGLCTIASENGAKMNFGVDTRVLQFAAYTFDVSNSEIFTTLIHGGCVCIPSEHDRMNDLPGVINKMKVNWTFLTPTVASLLRPAEVPTLKTLALGGEAVRQDSIVHWADHAFLINSYGPAECTVWTSHAALREGVLPANIGKGNGALLWIAEASNHDRLCPVGCVGELLVEGPILARAYLNDPEKTETAFIKNPKWLKEKLQESGESRRIYKTGDLAKYTKDGSIVYVGRKDSQVKLHGQRIELGEIEHHISTNALIRHSAVILPKTGLCKQRLVAVVSLEEFAPKTIDEAKVQILCGKERKAKAALQVSQIHDYLSEHVPAYMVPKTWVILENIPLSSSRKIDKVKLIKWVQDIDEETYREIGDFETPEVVDAPATATEKRLQKVLGWVLNLSVDMIGLNRSFLSLGGDSISAMQVIVKCRAENMAISVKDILRSKSISKLALCVKPIGQSSLSKHETFETPFELSPIQKMFFDEIAHDLKVGSGNYFNQSFLLRLARNTSAPDLAHAVQTIVRQHSMLRARYRRSDDGLWVQHIVRDAADSYRFCVHNVDDREQAKTVIAASQAGLDIENGPVFAVELINLKGDGQLLFLVAHHLVCDLVSWRVMLKDLEEALESGMLSSTERPLPFQTWARLQADYARQHLEPHKTIPHKVPAADYEYWGMANCTNMSDDVLEVGFTMDQESTSMLLTGCHKALGTDPVDVYLSALFHSFSQTFGRSPPTIFNEGHGRETWDSEIDLSGTVGWFTTMFPLHVQVNQETNIEDVTRRVKDYRRRVPKNGWSYFTSRYSKSDRVEAFRDHWPMEVLFNYLGLYQQLERADGLLQPEVWDVSDVGPKVQRMALFDISVVVLRGAARVSVVFNRHMQHQDKIRQWINSYEQSLTEAVTRLGAMETELTLSDFPLVPLTYDDLDRLKNKTLPQIGISSLNDLEDLYPCSPMQQGILLSQTKNSGTYEFQTICEVVPSRASYIVDVQRLQTAWQKVVDRHPSLRTIFVDKVSQEGLFDQLVLKQFTASVLQVECGDNDVSNTLSKLPPIDYSNARPPHRLTICHTPNDKVFCKLEISHSLIDGTSMSVLINDFGLAYEGKLPSDSGPLYSDYISYLQEQSPDLAMEYWTSYLADIQPCQFPPLTDGIDEVAQLRSAKVELTDASKLHEFCQEHGVTLANIFQIAWGLVLRTYTGLDQVCFGYLASGRDALVSGIDDAVGAFINMLVCRLDMTEMANISVLQVVEKVQSTYLQNLPHQHCSLAEIQHALNLSGKSLFNTVLSFQKRSSQSIAETSMISFEDMGGRDPTEYDISVNIRAGDGDVDISLSYLTSRLSEGHAANVANTFSVALSCILESSEEDLGNLHLFSDRDQDQILSWNETTPQLMDDCVHDIIRRQAALQTHCPAVCSWDGNFTYCELDELSTRLAHHLVTIGVAPEVLVPLCFEKSAWTLVAMLGVMKAGGAFVPLDPSYPWSRLQTIIDNTNAKVVLASPQTAKRFVRTVDKVVIVSKSMTWSLPELTSEVVTSVTPQNAMYTLFTSGSTGQPKGVLLEHAAVSSSITHHGREMGFGPTSRVFQFSSYTFDAAILEIFTTLAYGGCICVPSDADRMGNLGHVMSDMKINTSFLTPSLVRLIQPEDVPFLKTLILGGEAIGQDNVAVWADKVRLMCGYGPTETCVFCVCGTFSGSSNRADVLGRAVSSLSWIVEPKNHNRLAPVGSVGELLVQGPTLARGYLKDEQKTANAFIEDPAWLPRRNLKRPQRLYKTGDLVRYNSNGTITYLGRKDTQVKLRGQRIELGEIEHHVKANLPNSQSVAVDIITPIGIPEPTLAAFLYLVPDTEEQLSPENGLTLPISEDLRAKLIALQTSLTESLPSYMIPSMYIPLKQMPTTTAGKLNRDKLRQLASELPEAQLKSYSLVDGNKVLPLTDMEKKLHVLWTKVLNTTAEQIGAQDSFFRLGGDSIVAMRLAAAASAQEIPLRVADIFRNPTLSKMAAAAAGFAEGTHSSSELKPFELLGGYQFAGTSLEEAAAQCKVATSLIQDAYPCTPLQEGLMALSVRKPGVYMAQKIFSLPAKMNLQRLKEAWQKTVDMHPILRTRIAHTTALGSIQVVLQERIHWRSATSMDTYLQEDKENCVAYGHPLTRYAIIENGKGDRHFIWTAHHAMYDGWSVPLVFEQVQRMYDDESGFEAPPFNSFINFLTNTDAAASSSFWQSQLSGERPTSFPQPPSATHQLNVEQISLHTVQISRKPKSGIMMSTVLRAAWAMMVAQYSDSDDVVFGATLSGRNAPVSGVAKMLGPTITTVPIRIRLDRGRTIAQFLEDIQDQATEMIPFEHWGLQNISRLGPEARQAVDFQNLLVVQPAAEMDTQPDLLGAEAVPIPMANFDTYPLIVECSVNEGKVDIETRYDGTLISTQQMRSMLRQFEHVIWQLNDESTDTTLSEVDLFGPEDDRQVREWNRNYPEVLEACVREIFQKQVLARPDAPAVSAWDGDFTYRELDSLSTKLAHYLVGLGVGPEMLVPLCFDKSRWAVMAMLAVSKAGGACVNLGPTHPLNRLRDIIQQANAKVVLAAPQHVHLFDGFNQKIINVQPSLLEDLANPIGVDLPSISPTNPAVVLFTSGSTGKPKGIIIEHGSLCTSSQAHGSTWHIGPGTRVLQFAAYTFDVSVADIFTTIQRGGCVCVPSEQDRMNDLAGFIHKMKVNWAFLTPTVASLLSSDNIPSLKTLVLGGEAATTEVIQKWADKLELIICYGPAECTIYCAGNGPARPSSDPANLGHAIGALYWITDVLNHDRLAPVGCVGELLIEGRTVARGYLHDEKKTAAAFIENPSWITKRGSDERRRLYKTGDLVRYNSDGTIRFVGRKDTQVKVRGQRVELGEIEHNIMKNLPDLEQVTVDAIRQKHQQDRQAVAAFFCFPDGNPTHGNPDDLALPMTDDLRAKMIGLETALAESLPSYMVPSMYIPLAKIPLTQNGKTDRSKLRQLASGFTLEQATVYSLADVRKRAPSTQMEQTFQRLWAKTMGIEINLIGAGDHFFRLGGDSIIAMNLVGLASAEGIALSVADIFKCPSLADMAAIATVNSQNTPDQQLAYQPFSLLDVPDVDGFLQNTICSQIRVPKEDVADVLPATSFQSHVVSHALMKTRGLLNYILFDGNGPLDLLQLRRSCAQLVQDNDILRTVFALKGAQFVQVILKNLALHLCVYETDEDLAEFSNRLCHEDTKRELRLGEPFVRFMVVKQKADKQHRLIMRISHAQYDGICLPRVWSGLRTAYQGLHPETATLAPPFSNYVAETARRNTTECYQYWRDMLQNSSMTNIVAHHKPSYQGAYDFTAKQTIPLVSLTSSGITFATVIKAAWGLVLAQLGARSDVVFGHVISGRNVTTPKVEQIVGPCLNIIPVRVEFQAEWTVKDLLQQVQEQQVANIPFETLGFREITRHCTEWPNWTRFSSIVQHQNIDQDEKLSLGDVIYDIGDFCPKADEADVAIKSTPRGNQMEIILLSSSKAINSKFSQELLNKLCNTIQSISADLNMALPSPTDLCDMPPQLPVVLEAPSEEVTPPQISAIHEEDVVNIQSTLERAWQQVLQDQRDNNVELSLESSFFEIGGDLVAAAQLSALLHQDGFEVGVEDLIDWPVLHDQLALLSTKRRV